MRHGLERRQWPSARFAAVQQAVEIGQLMQAAGEASRIAHRRHEAGYSGDLDVLVAERDAQDAEPTRLQTRQARLDASVRLIKALGGGWIAPPA